MIQRWLFTQIDNSSLIIFRIIFGFLIAAEAIGSVFTGWIKRTLIEPQFTFNFLGFDFLQPLPGDGMYYYYWVMGFLGLLVMFGYRYRYSMVAFTIMWAGVYFMQKTSYNNHYYLLLLLCIIMCFLPANTYASWDAEKNPALQNNAMPRWCALVFVLQVWIVYTYASIAKIYPDWLDTTVARNLMASKVGYPIVGPLLQEHWAHICIAYFGILYDLLIVPLLLWKRTRVYAFGASVFFHLFNSFVLQIGIFPYLSLAFSLFFFSGEVVHRLFLKRKPFYNKAEIQKPSYHQVLLVAGAIWFAIQIALPLRHWFIPGDVLWTEEGHRLSWRMMLRGRQGRIAFFVVDKATCVRTHIILEDYLSRKQKQTVATRPDAIWQFAQRIRQKYANEQVDVAVYVESTVSVNGKAYRTLIDPNVDLAAVPWNYMATNPWLIKYDDDL